MRGSHFFQRLEYLLLMCNGPPFIVAWWSSPCPVMITMDKGLTWGKYVGLISCPPISRSSNWGRSQEYVNFFVLFFFFFLAVVAPGVPPLPHLLHSGGVVLVMATRRALVSWWVFVPMRPFVFLHFSIFQGGLLSILTFSSFLFTFLLFATRLLLWFSVSSFLSGTPFFCSLFPFRNSYFLLFLVLNGWLLRH